MVPERKVPIYAKWRIFPLFRIDEGLDGTLNQSSSVIILFRSAAVLLDMFRQRYPGFLGGFLCRRRFIP
jgi:hypothetical protein